MKRFDIHKTITGEIIKTVPNYRDKTFIIQNETARYRTYPMNKEEFNSCLMNTGNDWKYFLRSDDYYKVK
jgi:hypothetical protein